MILRNYINFINNSKYIYKNIEIRLKDIILFYKINKKKNNDSDNKIREIIIDSIFNKKTPEIYFKKSQRWLNIKKELEKFVKKLSKNEEIKKIECIQKAGRKYNYDYDLKINNKIFKIEFKYNTSSIKDVPQFVSPGKPSKYLSNNFEEFYYDNYLSKSKIKTKYEIDIPEREIYLKEVHNIAPKCMKKIKEKYKEDKEFCNYMTELYNNSTKEFIEKYDLNLDVLNEYLKESQKNKIYMLYKKNKIYMEENDVDNYILVSYIKEPNLKRYKAETKSGKKINILIRWKNGKGIAYPAFQISTS